MRLVTNEKFAELQRDPEMIRNVCILAHVDHGKTTLADSLVASNGIISGKLAGTLRYLDSRPDEQQRGITMKSSCIALCHDYDEREHLINLIDSPGHVDFASEVSTAVRLCDGAFVLVDVVEGVCPQTRSGLSVLYAESVKPIIVLNKIDRLITEMKLSPLDAYVHLTQVLEQVNAVMGELFSSDMMEREDKEELPENGEESGREDDRRSAMEKADDSNLYFSPERGNVLFSSAVDGWCFGVKDFAVIYAKTMGFSEKVLSKTLWGDFYMNTRAKRIMKGAQERAKKPLFVSFILENIWSVYDTVLVRKDREKIATMIEKMGIPLTKRDLRLTDSRARLKSICSQWLPLAKSCLDAVCDKIPSPARLSGEKIERLMCGNNEFSNMPEETRRLKEAFLNCSSNGEAPTIAFVSKMFSVERKSLPENRARLPTKEELEERRERARARHALAISSENSDDSRATTTESREEKNAEEEFIERENKAEETENALIAFARVYSGAIVQGQELFVLGPKHDPKKILEKRKLGEFPEPPPSSLRDLTAGYHVTKVRVSKLYIMMGRELEAIDRVSAGNVLGIGGLEEHVLKTAVLSTSVACPAFSELTSLAVPILRVALEPKHSSDLQKLISGLKLLNQADACALVHIQETGEIVLNTAGEVHLERCLEDLKNRYGKVDVNVSEPIVSFRETVVAPPKVDMVNEAIERKIDETPIVAWTANRQCHLEIEAKPLPEGVTKLLESNGDLMKKLDLHWESGGSGGGGGGGGGVGTDRTDFRDDSERQMSERRLKLVQHFRNELEEAFNDAGWSDTIDKIWSFGPRKCGSNVLINETDYRRGNVWQRSSSVSDDPRAVYDSSIVNGFQLATLAGPLCEEPMMGVCFVVKRWDFHDVPPSTGDFNGQCYSQLGGQLMSACKDALRRALLQRRPRLVTPMYSCSVLVNSDVLGKLYAVFGRRQGRVSAESALGFGGHFRVLATLPVPESFQLARELRTQTSGLASPQLVFSHWEVIEQDPYWVPSTEEEYLHFGEKADSGNRAKKYIDAVRRRKGLPVDSQLVTHAEKQRTLSKNK